MNARLLGLSLALLLAPAALAQTAPTQTAPAQTSSVAQPASAQALSLAQTLSALTQAPGWRAAALQYLSASQNLDAARARAGLSVSAGASVNAFKVPIDGDWNSATTLNVQAAINVLPWSSAQGSVLQATRGLYRAGLDQRDSQNSLALSVVQGYLSARQAAAGLALAQEQQALAGRQLEIARAQQAGGTLTREGLLAAQASQEQAAAATADAATTFDTALRQLYTTLGSVPAGLDPQSPPVFASAPAVPGAPEPLDTLLARAVQGRSEVLKAASNLQDAQTAVQAASLDRRLPDVSLNVQYGQLALSSTGTAGNTVSSSLNLKTGQLSASASLPLNQGGTAPPTGLALGLSGSFSLLNPVADTTVKSTQTALALAQLSLVNAQASVDLDVRQKYAALQNALLALTAPRTSLLRAQTALASAQARLQAGLSTALDVQQAALNLQQAQNTLDQAVNGAYLAQLALSVATTEFSPALIVSSDAPAVQPVAAQATPVGTTPAPASATPSLAPQSSPTPASPTPPSPTPSTGGQP